MSSLRVTLEAPETAWTGDPVAYAVVISNTGSEPLDLYLQGREPTFDLRVADEAGATVWRRLEGQSVQAILRIDSLAPGEEMSLDGVWNQRNASGTLLAPGVYVLQAEVLTDGQPLMSQKRELRLTMA